MKVLVLVVIAVLFIPICQANSAPKVVFTVDVESKGHLTLPAQVNTVCDDGSPCGLMEIARMLRERGIAGIFFLNVYEHTRWGKEALRDITIRLRAAGQDVALHTHPETAYDPSRKEMYKYTRDEQTAIIRDGAQLLSSWTGQPVLAHRAGNYSADEGTLAALEGNGVRLDSSLFWGHPECRLTRLNLPRNLPSTRGRLVELPVTVYQRQERPKYFGNIFAPVTSVRKIDPNWFVDQKEASAAIDAVVKADVPFIVVFLHSYSLMGERGKGRTPVLNHRARSVFRAIIADVAEKRLQVMSMQDVAGSAVAAGMGRNADVIPRVRISVGLNYYLWHRLQAFGKEGAVLNFAVLPFVAACNCLLLVWRRRSSRRKSLLRGISPP